MALSQTKLYNKILSIFQTKRMEPDPDNPGQLREVSPTMIIFAKELSDYYDDYAMDAETYANDPLISAGKSIMKTMLEQLETSGNTASIVATIIGNAAKAYWNTAIFSLAPFPPGFSVVFTITVTPPTMSATSTCIADLISAMSTGSPDTVQAMQWATALHNQALSVKTTHIGLDTTVPTPLPKTESDKPIQ